METERRNAPAAGASWINVLAGLWLIVSPWMLGYASGSMNATWNSVIVGIAVVALAWLGATTSSASPCWWNIILGIWLVISPYVLRFDGIPLANANAMTLGIVVGILALIAGLAKMPPSTVGTMHRT